MYGGRGGGGSSRSGGLDEDEEEDGGGPELIKSLQEAKLKSFSIGTMAGRRQLSKKEQEQIKKKQQEDEVGKVRPLF